MLDQNQEIIALAMFSKKSSKAAGQMRDLMLDVQATEDISLTEKRAKIKELELAEKKIYGTFISVLRDAKKEAVQ